MFRLKHLIHFLELVLLWICLVMVLYAIQYCTASSPVCIEIRRWIYVETAIGQSKISALLGHFVVDIAIISTIDTFIQAAKIFWRGKAMNLFFSK